MTDIADAIISRLRTLPDVRVTDRGEAYAKGGPGAGTITVAVTLTADPGNARLADVALDIDVWTAGPDTAAADALAHSVEALLDGWNFITTRQGYARLRAGSRAPVPDDDEKVAHVTMRFTGRAFRRYEP